MISALFPVIANIIITLSENYNLSEVGYLIYFISTDWLLIYAVRFVTEYCGYPYRGTWLERTLGMLGGIDFIMLLGNHWFHHAFGLSEVVLENGHIYYKYYSLWYHGIHLAFSYFMTAALVILLIMKLTHTAAIYREKYFVMLGTVLVIGVWELYYVVNKSILEYSMISYAVLPVIVAFFALVYKPYFATYRMFKEVMLNISEAIFFNDDKNDCIYINRRAKEILDYVGKSQEEAWDYAVEVLAGGDVYVMEDIMNEGYFQALRNYTFGEESFTFELELQKLTDKKGRYVGSFITAKDRTEEQKRLDKERYQATHDSLTGLYNADYLYTRIEKMLMEDPNHRYVIVASDIKSFKMVNDVYGRKVGDEILINIARQIEALSTKYTIYGRIGSDKFGLIMRRENFSESLFNTQVKKVTMLNTEMIYPIVIHVGVYEVTDRRIPVSVMFDRAYMALMTIKNDMQKRVAYYDSNLREDMLWEQRIDGSIDVGLEQNQIVPYLQSQVLSDGTIIGAEMLARWQHPTEGFLKPRRFLPTLEKNGYVVRLDQFMWEQACRTIKRWEESGWDELYISVNISPVDFFFMDVVDEFCNLIKKYDVEPGKLRLEITENTMMYD
ncbi:MAG: EAL domain-containing protein, partial [Eubacterium sp.]|nr:EAL domain-containing protein [Eubacterium sp.]